MSDDLPASRAPQPHRDRLDDILIRNRGLLVGGYLLALATFLALASGLNFDAVAEIPHGLVAILRGDSDPWDVFIAFVAEPLTVPDAYMRYAIIVAYVVLQGLLLWGAGKVFIDRRPKWRGRMLVSVICIVTMAMLLTFGGFGLLVSAIQTSWGGSKFVSFDTSDLPLYSVTAIDWAKVLIGGWIFWFVVVLIYLQRSDPAHVLPRCIHALLAGSWIEFSLALPIDIAARNEAKDCPCAAGSWVTLIVAAPVLIWSIGPALYLLYQRERALSREMPGRSTAILLRKTAVTPSRASEAEAKVESHVSTARTLSLAAILLGYAGFQFGMFNSERGLLFNEARGLIVVEWLKQQFHDDAALRAKIAGNNPLAIENTPFGRIEIGSPRPSSGLAPSKEVSIFGIRLEAPGRPPFGANAKRDGETWPVGAFSLDDKKNRDRLDKIERDLEIDASRSPDDKITAIREKLYGRRVKLPGVDFGEFGTVSAAWLAALICPAFLVVLRNAIRQIFRSGDVGSGEPWLVLDAETPLERAVAIVWLLGIGASGWLATFGLILTVMDVFQTAAPNPSLLAVALGFTVFLTLLLVSTWPAFASVLDLLRLRELRRDAKRKLDDAA